MRPVSGIMLTLVMLAIPVDVLSAAGSDSDSPYDRNPQCLDRHASTATNCVINDGPPPRQFVRRFRQEVVNGPQTAADSGNVTKRASPAVSHAAQKR